jgi:hypothetical protein
MAARNVLRVVMDDRMAALRRERVALEECVRRLKRALPGSAVVARPRLQRLRAQCSAEIRIRLLSEKWLQGRALETAERSRVRPVTATWWSRPTFGIAYQLPTAEQTIADWLLLRHKHEDTELPLIRLCESALAGEGAV